MPTPTTRQDFGAPGYTFCTRASQFVSASWVASLIHASPFASTDHPSPLKPLAPFVMAALVLFQSEDGPKPLPLSP